VQLEARYGIYVWAMIQSFGSMEDEQQVDGDELQLCRFALNGSEGTTTDKYKERNREHAKRTRLRKKELTEAMKLRLQDLQREVRIIDYTSNRLY